MIGRNAKIGICLTVLAGCAGLAASQAFTSGLDPLDTIASRDAAIQAATPPDCPAPMPDALVASAGVQSKCMPRPDAVRATQVQALTVVTDANGNFSGSWPVPFVSTPTGRYADIDVTSASSAPYKCSFVAGAVTATGFTGKCWQIVATTLPTTLAAVLGLTVSPLSNAAAGLTVRVIGRQ